MKLTPRCAGTSFARLISLLLMALWPASVQAQNGEPARSANTVALGRNEFEAGVLASREGRWEEARVRFAQAYELVPAPQVLLNLAGAEAHTGRLLASAAHYRQFLRTPSQQSVASFTDAARQALAEVERRTPHVHIVAPDAAPDDRVLLDDQPVERAALAAELPVDPGVHRIVVVRSGRTVAEEEFTLAEHERREVRLALPAAVQSTSAVPRTNVRMDTRAILSPRSLPRSDGAHRSVFASPWFWLAAGVLVTGAVGSAVYLGTSGPNLGSYTVQ